MGATLTTQLPLLREHYHELINDIWFTTDKTITPAMAAMEAKSVKNGAGRLYRVPIQWGSGSSVSSTFSVAQGISEGTDAGSSAECDSWEIPLKTIEATAEWSRETMLATEGDSDERYNVLQTEMDAKIAKMRKRVATCVFESGYGRVGTMTAVGSSQITLGTSQVNRIEVNDWLNASSSSTGALRYATGARVTGIDPDTGVCTMAVDVSGGSYSWGSTDTVFFQGDHTSGIITQPVGFPLWVPASAPSGALFGVTRTGNPKLTGLRQDCRSLDHATALIRGAQKLFKFSSVPSVAYLSAEDYGTLTCDKESTKLVAVTLGKYEIGFDAFPLNTPAGLVRVLPDAMMEQGTYWMGPFNDRKLAPFMIHNMDLVNVDDMDGREISRKASSTNLELRLYSRLAIVVPFPGAYLCGSDLATS